MHSLNEYSSGPGTVTPSACGPARAASARRWRTSRGPVRHPRVWTWMKVPEVWRRRYRVESWAARGAEGCEEGRRCCESWPPGLGAFVRVSASSVGGVGDAFQCCLAKSQGAQRRGVPNLEGAKTHTTSPLPNVPSKCPPVKLIQLNLRASRSSARVLSQPPSLSHVGPSASSAPLKGAGSRGSESSSPAGPQRAERGPPREGRQDTKTHCPPSPWRPSPKLRTASRSHTRRNECRSRGSGMGTLSAAWYAAGVDEVGFGAWEGIGCEVLCEG